MAANFAARALYPGAGPPTGSHPGDAARFESDDGVRRHARLEGEHRTVRRLLLEASAKHAHDDVRADPAATCEHRRPAAPGLDLDGREPRHDPELGRNAVHLHL